MTNQVQQWAGEFGNDYTDRNRVDWTARYGFWKDRMASIYGVRSVLEVGCNAGWNLTAIKAAAPHVATYGADVNSKALAQAQRAGHHIYDWEATEIGSRRPNEYDLVFTAGVLIHIPPDKIRAAMESIAQASSRYVLAIEYEGIGDTEIVYRGQKDMLWKRNYGAMYDGLGLQILRSGSAPKSHGFDDCAWWLLEKPQ